MSAQKEVFYAKLGLILTVLGLLLGYLYWRYPWQPASGEVAVDTTQTDEGTETVTEPSGDESESTPPPSTATGGPQPAEKTASELPAEFTLRDGEQKVLLTGQASVGIQFNQIGEERFLTLRINSSEGSENHAILNTGARFRFREAGLEYYVSVLSFDYAARTSVLRVDRAARGG